MVFEDRPEEPHEPPELQGVWALGRRAVPGSQGREGCVILLVGALVLVIVVLLIAVLFAIL